MPCHFYRFSTAGNTTLFVESPVNWRKALRAVPAEQGGVADLANSRLEMIAGEFCLNASLAFAALMDMRGRRPEKLEIAGCSLPISASGVVPHWLAALRMPLAEAHVTRRDEAALAELPGISHLLICANALPDPAAALCEAARLRAARGMDNLPAAGIVWWRNTARGAEILPVVSVPSAGTVCIEQACGSASLALAAALGKPVLEISQPSGECLKITLEGSFAQVEAPVSLLAEGELRTD